MSKDAGTPSQNGKRKSKSSDAASPKKSKRSSSSLDPVASSSSNFDSPSSKKPKAKSGQATLQVEGSKTGFGYLSESGAALASFADYTPAPSTKFSLYRADGLPDESGERTAADERLLLVGETDTISYVGNNFEFGSSYEARGYTGEYMIGVYDSSSSTVTLRAVPTFQVARSIKANNALSSISSTRAFADYNEMTMARRALGEAFGNRKQKANARNQDRMKVDTANMEVILDDFTGGIQDSLASLPSLDEVLASSTSARPMPAANLDAKHPAEAYRISDLIPTEVFRSLPIQKLIDNVDDSDALKEQIPYSKEFPAWIWSRLVDNLQRSSHLAGVTRKKHTTFDDDDDDTAAVDGEGDVMMPALGATEDKEDAKDKVRIAYYMSLLWFIHSRPKSVSARGKLISALKLDGEDANKRIIKCLLCTFTETPANSDRSVMSAFHQTKVMAYLCALALHLDNFSVDYDKLARNCNIPPATLRELFRTLGCTSSIVGGEKRMVLKTPFTLPQPRKGKAGGRK